MSQKAAILLEMCREWIVVIVHFRSLPRSLSDKAGSMGVARGIVSPQLEKQKGRRCIHKARVI